MRCQALILELPAPSLLIHLAQSLLRPLAHAKLDCAFTTLPTTRFCDLLGSRPFTRSTEMAKRRVGRKVAARSNSGSRKKLRKPSRRTLAASCGLPCKCGGAGCAIKPGKAHKHCTFPTCAPGCFGTCRKAAGHGGRHRCGAGWAVDGAWRVRRRSAAR